MKRRRRWLGYLSGYDARTIVEPDFDNAEIDLLILREEIAARGVLRLHPNEDRLNVHHDPVPLHSFVPDSAREESEFFNKRMFVKRRVLEIRERRRIDAECKAQWEKAQEERRSLRAEEERRRPRHHEAPLPRIYESPPRVPKWWENAQWTDEQAMINNMRIAEPLAPGIARIWQWYVMINDGDMDNPTLKHYGPWVEVWRGSGKTIFKVKEQP